MSKWDHVESWSKQTCLYGTLQKAVQNLFEPNPVLNPHITWLNPTCLNRTLYKTGLNQMLYKTCLNQMLYKPKMFHPKVNIGLQPLAKPSMHICSKQLKVLKLTKALIWQMFRHKRSLYTMVHLVINCQLYFPPYFNPFPLIRVSLKAEKIWLGLISFWVVDIHIKSTCNVTEGPDIMCEWWVYYSRDSNEYLSTRSEDLVLEYKRRYFMRFWLSSLKRHTIAKL